jgi:carboxyl-terminal processing protease
MKTSLSILLLGFAGIIASTSCEKQSHREYVNNKMYDLMTEVYLWNDNLPPAPDPEDFSPQEYMEALRYEQFDRWSYVSTYDEYAQYFEEGIMIGHGFSLGLDADDNIRIVIVYRGTEAFEKGIKRGWILTKINGAIAPPNNQLFEMLGPTQTGVENTLTFIDENGYTVDITLTKEELELTPVLHSEVIEQDGDIIGYMVFQDFIQSAYPELNEVFQSFSDSGINELIIDLRYNGGGYVDVAEFIAGWLIGKDFAGEPFLYYEHNAILNKPPYSLDTMYTVPAKSDGLSLDRIFFIGTENTASASELLITGTEPFLPNSMTAGSTTHGKPVGMYGYRISDYMAFPICFRYFNHDHEGDFYEGLPPDLPAEDDLTRDFGDPEEASLRAVLNYIATGAVPMKSASEIRSESRMITPTGPMGEYLRAL